MEAPAPRRPPGAGLADADAAAAALAAAAAAAGPPPAPDPLRGSEFELRLSQPQSQDFLAQLAEPLHFAPLSQGELTQPGEATQPSQQLVADRAPPSAAPPARSHKPPPGRAAAVTAEAAPAAARGAPGARGGGAAGAGAAAPDGDDDGVDAPRAYPVRGSDALPAVAAAAAAAGGGGDYQGLSDVELEAVRGLQKLLPEELEAAAARVPSLAGLAGLDASAAMALLAAQPGLGLGGLSPGGGGGGAGRGKGKQPKGVHPSLKKAEHRHSRATRRGPMDEMRQLMRILTKLLTADNGVRQVLVEDQGGGNRVSEDQIKEYLRYNLGEAPQPEWGLPDGWGSYLSELFTWATGRLISKDEAMACARRQPGRSWEAVQEKLYEIGVHCWNWPVPLTLDGCRNAAKTAPPATPAQQLTKELLAGGARRAAPGAGSPLGVGSPGAGAGDAKRARVAVDPSEVDCPVDISSLSEVDTWRVVVAALYQTDQQRAAAGGGDAEAEVGGLRDAARALLLQSEPVQVTAIDLSTLAALQQQLLGQPAGPGAGAGGAAGGGLSLPLSALPLAPLTLPAGLGSPGGGTPLGSPLLALPAAAAEAAAAAAAAAAGPGGSGSDSDSAAAEAAATAAVEATAAAAAAAAAAANGLASASAMDVDAAPSSARVRPRGKPSAGGGSLVLPLGGFGALTAAARPQEQNAA
ncbi:hypothetical protein Rsub_11682 [Raphidocelis subcapitata]|uniref:Uncharacterized protein n=1 Tax=Raphidocelis subcapitata TaxID=307507 RepID=A0A2V0PHH5_9CHLO|nr:hypothetical protein Rsub_11682 [Raphidocelis subcapitata]|eukprot:GBF98472.1 hypothetical protein Rsub_11682 [Raphidocelis subcapitata]